jgi:O-antigen/teichoic acid export membrane protein
MFPKYLCSIRVRKVGGEFFWVASGQAAVALGGLVAVKALTQKLPPLQYGELALGMTFCTLVNLTMFAGPGAAALRFFTTAREHHQIKAFIKAISSMTVLRTFLMCGLSGIVLMGLLMAGSGKWTGIITASIFLAVFSSYTGILDCIQNAARQRVVVAWHQGLFQWLRFLIAVAFINLLGAFSAAAMWGYVLASIVILASQLLFFFSRIAPIAGKEQDAPPALVSKWTAQLNSYSWPFAYWGIFTWLLTVSDRWVLQIFTQTSEVGLYAVLYQLGYYPISVMLTMVVQLLVPLIFARAGSGADRLRQSRARELNVGLFMGSMCITLVMTVAAYFFHAQIFSVLVAPEFRSISVLLPAMVLSGGVFGCGQVASILLMSGSETSLLLAPKIGSALLGVMLNVAGAYLFGVRGVVWAGVLISLCYLTWILFLARRSASLVRDPVSGIPSG